MKGFENPHNSDTPRHSPDIVRMLNGHHIEELGHKFMSATLAFQRYYAERCMLRDASNEMMPYEQSRHDTYEQDLSLEQRIEKNGHAIRTWLESMQGKLAIYTYAKDKTLDEIEQMKWMENLEEEYISSLH